MTLNIKWYILISMKQNNSRKARFERMVTMTDYRSSAAALYDGGWRAEDKEELIAEYQITEEEAAKICEILAEFEA